MDAWRYGIYLLVFTFDISLVRCQCEHSKINSISPRAHVLFSIYSDFFCYFSLGKISLFNEVKVKSAYEPSGSPGRSLSRTRNIATTPSIKFAGTHLYTWVERGTVRVECLAQERNTMFPARARTRTARSEVELSNHESTAPPTSFVKGALSRGFRRFLVLTVLKSTLPTKNIIFEHLKEDMTLICG